MADTTEKDAKAADAAAAKAKADAVKVAAADAKAEEERLDALSKVVAVPQNKLDAARAITAETTAAEAKAEAEAKAAEAAAKDKDKVIGLTSAELADAENTLAFRQAAAEADKADKKK